MPDEVLHFLRPAPGQTTIDATVGSGGHALLLYEAMRGQGTLVALDRDPEMIELAKRRFDEKGISSRAVRWIVGSFGDLAEHLAGSGIRTFDRIVYDFGLNSVQLADPARGFSFSAREGPLDARYSREEPIPTLAEWLARIHVEELERVLRDYGGERWARRIARAIVRRRERSPIETTGELAAVIRSAVPPMKGWRRIDAATRSFQALRILVNNELDHVERGLEQGIQGLAPNGRIVAIAYHSGEDRLVKQALRHHSESGEIEILTRKPVRPTEGERERNPRARSARLRAGMKIQAEG